MNLPRPYMLKNTDKVLLDVNPSDEEPSLKVGTLTASVAGLLSLLSFFAPNLMSDKATTIILVVSAFVLPLVTAFLVRGKVWSPASVNEVVAEAVAIATKELKERLETQRALNENKFPKD